MDESGIFQIDTKGICLLCLKDCILYDYFGGAGGTKIKKEIGSCTRSISFKMLLRYLKINLFQLCNFPSSFMESMDMVDEQADIVTSVCNECFFLIKKFSKLYESMEQIRLQVDLCVQNVHEVMTNGTLHEGRVDEYERRRRTRNVVELITANISDQLRKETMRKCSLRVQGLVPKVNLYKRCEATLKSSFGFATSSSTTPFYNRKQPGPKSKTDNNSNDDPQFRNHHSKQLLNQSQSNSELYADSNELLATFTNQNEQKSKAKPKAQTSGARKRSGGGQTASSTLSKRVATNWRNKIQSSIDSISREEFVVKVEPTTISSSFMSEDEDQDPFNEIPEPQPIPIPIPINANFEFENPNAVDVKKITTRVGLYSCMDCDLSFDTGPALWRHQNACHKNIKQRIRKEIKISPPAPPPPKETSSPSGRKRRLRCKTCKRMFTSQARLLNHMKTHSKKSSPSKKKKTAASANKRKKTVGVGRGRQTQASGDWNCEFCSKWFKNRPVYQTHLRAIHSIHVFKDKLPEGTTEHQLNCAIKRACAEYNSYPTDPSKKHYGCSYCDGRFPHPSHLRLHIIKRHFDVIAEKVKNLEGLEEGDDDGMGEFDETGQSGIEIEFETEGATAAENEDGLLYQYYDNGDEEEGNIANGDDEGNYDNNEDEVETEINEEDYEDEGHNIMEDEGEEVNDSIQNGFVIEEVVGEVEVEEAKVRGEEEENYYENEIQQGQGENVEDGEGDNDDHEDPPILMKETYSLSETVIEGGEMDDNHQDEELLPV